MNEVTGIKSVDFKVTAKGYGVVNWNGAVRVMGNNGKPVDNHSIPKLRGYTNLVEKVNKDNEKFYGFKDATDFDPKKNPLYISQNCIRHHLFRDHAFDLHFASEQNLIDILASLTGLIRGYVITASQCKRTSPLLIEDFVDELGNGNFEQMGRAGSKEKEINKKGEESSTSMFSKITFGETKYTAYGSISIEQLQFISLDDNFDRPAMKDVKLENGKKIAKKIEDFIKSLDPGRNPKAKFHEKYVRKGTVYQEGEAGILLDDTAIDILIKKTLQMLIDLNIRQAKGYMYVDSLEMDYNDSKKMMRIKENPMQVDGIKVLSAEQIPSPNKEYAVYYYPDDKSGKAHADNH